MRSLPGPGTNRMLAVVVLASALLNACTVDSVLRDVSPETTAGHWQEHIARLQKLTGWRIRGKVSLKRDGESFAAPFIWKYHLGHSRIYLLDAFGWPRARIEWSPDGVGYFNQSGRQQHFASLHDLSRRHFGFDLPLAAIRYWVTGAPRVREQINNLHFSSAEGLMDFEQSGWHVQYLAYQDVGGYTLPAKIRMEKQNARALFLINGWNDLGFPEKNQEED